MNWYQDLLNGNITKYNWPVWIVIGVFTAVTSSVSIAIVVVAVVGSIAGIVLFWLSILTPYTFGQLLGMLGL